MIRDMILPQLAMGMSEGTLIDWVVAEGKKTSRDETLVVIETEKVTTELPAPYAGYLHIVVEKGTTVPTETVIARIAETEAEYKQLTGGGAAPAPVAVAAAVAVQAAPQQAAAVAVTGRRILVSGLAKKIAQQNGLDLSAIQGSGPGGRIVRKDVLEAMARPVAVSTARALPVAGMRERQRIGVTGMRKVIAERMVKSKTTAPHVYMFFEVDISKLVAVRDTMLAREKQLGGRISQIALLTRATALAIREAPILNAHLVGDEIVVWDNVNVGIAVALPGRTDCESGLIVPVVRNAESKGVLAIDREIREMVARARAGQATAEDLADGTITLSSTSGFAPGTWLLSSPLINQPQVAIFQPGTPIDKPVVVDGQVAIRTMLPCSLSWDHRAMDGEPAGRFVRALSDLLSNPELMLL